ncbi:methylated-DNA--[protein]-cysteine S-methyltransferase [Planomicrobium okeanokoites]|uniref:methylated-DNA--[protein]-cysteine S-methyltransferase n=1 Tax=Planomicrobium okeanokoites TaxID=244 RepID=UPI0024913B54|nr:methylated-DNA--[protein]-cysteine S-methyltransferase [Planomicrobium okeanokoites]
MSNLYQVDYESPIGVMEVVGTEQGILSVLFTEREEVLHQPQPDMPQVLNDCLRELDEYFKGERMDFTVHYISEGTEFQGKVWSALTTVGYAETASYRDIAVKVGSEKAVRAVGNANSKNKLTIIVPCHRVIGTNGKLTGYAGTLTRKEWLLKHEQATRSKNTL